jgi:hypothetical protein
MWSDTLLGLERAHLLQLIAWSAMSMVIGTALYAWVTVGRSMSILLRHFAFQTGLWGTVVFAIGIMRLRDLAERDLASATRLDRLVWLSVGLDGGFVLVGVALATAGWLMGRHLGLVGAGIAVIVQGTGLLVLDLRFLVIMERAL